MTHYRISGLDPAQPGFDLSDPDDTLGPEDADFVGERTKQFLGYSCM